MVVLEVLLHAFFEVVDDHHRQIVHADLLHQTLLQLVVNSHATALFLLARPARRFGFIGLLIAEPNAAILRSLQLTEHELHIEELVVLSEVTATLTRHFIWIVLDVPVWTPLLLVLKTVGIVLLSLHLRN